jgi:hypothetical protein
MSISQLDQLVVDKARGPKLDRFSIEVEFKDFLANNTILLVIEFKNSLLIALIVRQRI